MMRKQNGQTLLEILLAFTASIMVMSAIVVGITTSLSNAQYTKNQNLANFYAREGMAVLKQIKNSSWNDFRNLEDFYATNTTYCLGPNSTNLAQASSQSIPCRQTDILVGGIFSREIKFEHDSVSCANGGSGSKATVKVSWSDNKCPVGSPYCHKAEIITCFSNLDQNQTP